MPLQDAIIPVDFGGGIDGKTDPKKTVPGKFLLTENGVYTELSQVRKRNGYTAITNAILGGGTLTAPAMMRVFNGELVCQDSGTFYGYSETLVCWIPKGYYQSIDLRNQGLGGDVAILNNISLTGDGKVVDQQTGAELAQLAVTHPNGVPILLGSSVLAVLSRITAGSTIVIQILTATAAGISLGAPITVATDGFQFDAATTVVAHGVDGCVVSYLNTGGGFTTKQLDTTGTVTATATVANTATGNSIPVHVNVDAANGNIWVYYGTLTALAYRVYTSALVVLNTQTITTGAVAVLKPTAISISATQQRVYYAKSQTIGGNAAAYFTWTAVTTTSGAVTGDSVLLPEAPSIIPVSRVFTVGGRNYLVLFYEEPQNGTMQNATASTLVQNTLFILDLTNLTVVSRFAAQRANAGENLSSNPMIMRPALLNSTTMLLGVTIAQNDLVNTAGEQQSEVFTYVFTWGANRAYKSEVCGNLLICNGSLLTGYDGVISAEWGFNLYPEIVEVIKTAGSSIDGNYVYKVIFEWVDDQGNLHSSETSPPIPVHTEPTSVLNIYAITPKLTQKPVADVNTVFYRTTASGTVFYRIPIDGVNGVTISAPQGSVGFRDFTPDSVLLAQNQLYTTGGVLDNTPSAPSMVIVPRPNRLWYVDAENPNDTWYSKSFQSGVGLSPSAFLTLQGIPDLGPIIGLSPLDDKLIQFKERGIQWFGGDGAGDTGQNSSLSIPQSLPSDVGIAYAPSIILTPKGIIFQTPKGFYLLDRSLGLHYMDQYFSGAAVEQYNSQVTSDARMTPSTSQIRFLTQSGSTLLYDYIFDKWATFTNHLGIAADVWQGTYVYLRTDGRIYQENTTTYLDNATSYQLRVKTSWLALGSVQGFERVRIAQMLGDYASGTSAAHGMQISFAYDFAGNASPTYSTAIPYTFAASTSGPFQYRTFPTQQKCDSISLLLEEIVTGASGEYIDFTNLSFNAGMKKGLNKLAAVNSVG